MFGDVDTSKPHTIVRVHHTTRMMGLRRIVLTPGEYLIQGDARRYISKTSDRQKMQAGILDVEYCTGVDAAPLIEDSGPLVDDPIEEADETVNAQSQFDTADREVRGS